MIERLLQFLSEYFLNLLLGYQKWQAEKKLGAKRDSGWSAWLKELRKKRDGGRCVITGSLDSEGHHILPFHKRPDLEKVESNIIFLRRDMHFLIAHLLSWFSWNENVVEDAEWLAKKIKNRP